MQKNQFLKINNNFFELGNDFIELRIKIYRSKN